MHIMSKYFMELALCDYGMVHLLPSLLAAAALWLAVKLLNVGKWVGHWLSQKRSLPVRLDLISPFQFASHMSAVFLQNPVLSHYSGYTEEHLQPSVRLLCQLLLKTHSGRSKYQVRIASFLVAVSIPSLFRRFERNLRTRSCRRSAVIWRWIWSH